MSENPYQTPVETGAVAPGVLSWSREDGPPYSRRDGMGILFGLSAHLLIGSSP